MPSLGLDRPIDAFQQGSFVEVITLTEQPAVAATPRALYLRGRAYKALGDPAAAADSYRGALRIDPQYSDALTSLGIALRAQGLLQEPAACYAKAVDLTPQAVEAWINLGNVRLDQRKLEQAQDCFERALELQPRSWLALHRRLPSTSCSSTSTRDSDGLARHTRHCARTELLNRSRPGP